MRLFRTPSIQRIAYVCFALLAPCAAQAETNLSKIWVNAGFYSAHFNYLGTYYQPWREGNFKFGVVGGVFNGYPKAFDGGWFPAVLPVVSWETQQLGLNVMLVPPLKDRLYGAVSFQLKYRFEN